jgi:hypothetical protein
MEQILRRDAGILRGFSRLGASESSRLQPVKPFLQIQPIVMIINATIRMGDALATERVARISSKALVSMQLSGASRNYVGQCGPIDLVPNCPWQLE